MKRKISLRNHSAIKLSESKKIPILFLKSCTTVQNTHVGKSVPPFNICVQVVAAPSLCIEILEFNFNIDMLGAHEYKDITGCKLHYGMYTHFLKQTLEYFWFGN